MINPLSASEIDVVSGGQAHHQVAGADYVGRINGSGGHYDMYMTSDGCLVAIWHAD